jgi:prepilin-type N-terminal cleavage/methylation domain-containing protein
MAKRKPISQHKGEAPGRGAFTLIELLIVIAVIGIMGALIISSVTNAANDARLVMATQQQVVVQEALNAWVAANSGGGTNSSGQTRTTEDARTLYNNASTQSAKLGLLQSYLHTNTYGQFTTNLQTDAMQKIGRRLQFSTWGTNATNNYPRVEMVTN